MPVVPDGFIEDTAFRLAELESEVNSYADELAAMTLRAEAAEVELRRIRAAYPDVD